MGERLGAHFDPALFEVSSLERAWQLTVGDLEFNPGELIRGADRREPDTSYTIDFVSDHLSVTQDSTLLDYGCGTGRIAKGLINKTNCKVYGVDASISMLGVAKSFVNSDRFVVTHNDSIGSYGKIFDDAISLWVLQHCETPSREIQRIFRALKPNGRFLVFNENIRLVPTKEYGFGNDGVNVKVELEAVFGACIAFGKLNPMRVYRKFAERSFWAIYRKR